MNDSTEVGENALDNHFPWDTIPSSHYDKLNMVQDDKIAELAKVIPGLALFMLAGLVFLLAGTQSTLDRRAIWERVTWASEAAQ